MVAHVFFDFFGTLVDYEPSTHPAYNAPLAFARRAGSTLSVDASNARWQRAWDDLETQAAHTGREYSMQQVAQRFWRSIGAPPLPDNAIDTLIAEYLDAWTVNVTPATAALDCVADLATDHRLTIVTNTHDRNLVPRLVRRFRLDTAIDTVIASVEVGWRKPHPEIFETAMRVRGAAPHDVVFVGDNWEADIEGPRRLGMSTVYVGEPSVDRPSAAVDDLPGIIRSLM